MLVHDDRVDTFLEEKTATRLTKLEEERKTRDRDRGGLFSTWNKEMEAVKTVPNLAGSLAPNSRQPVMANLLRRSQAM
jgi:hypothetical protein